jgi:hypothetical protein
MKYMVRSILVGVRISQDSAFMHTLAMSRASTPSGKIVGIVNEPERDILKTKGDRLELGYSKMT